MLNIEALLLNATACVDVDRGLSASLNYSLAAQWAETGFPYY
jgi:hypothetical protein